MKMTDLFVIISMTNKSLEIHTFKVKVSDFLYLLTIVYLFDIKSKTIKSLT